VADFGTVRPPTDRLGFLFRTHPPSFCKPGPLQSGDHSWCSPTIHSPGVRACRYVLACSGRCLGGSRRELSRHLRHVHRRDGLHTRPSTVDAHSTEVARGGGPVPSMTRRVLVNRRRPGTDEVGDSVAADRARRNGGRQPGGGRISARCGPRPRGGRWRLALLVFPPRRSTAGQNAEWRRPCSSPSRRRGLRSWPTIAFQYLRAVGTVARACPGPESGVVAAPLRAVPLRVRFASQEWT